MSAANAPIPKWAVNGVTLPRNPTVFNIQHDTANVTYVKMADGTQRRIVPPNALPGANITMEWQFADSRIQNATLALLNQGILSASSTAALSKILLDGELPAIEIWAYLDTPTVQYSGHHAKSGNANDLIIDQRLGQGGVRKDIALDGRMDGPYLHSHYAVPAGNAPNNINLAMDTNFASWSKAVKKWGNAPGTGMTISLNAGPASTTAIVLAAPPASTSATGFKHADSDPIPVTPGQWYALSGSIDNTQVSAGTTFWGLYDVNISVEYKRVPQNAGVAASRVSGTWQCPSNVTQVRIICDTNNATVVSGGTPIFANPQLERVASATSPASAYQANGSLSPGYLNSDIQAWFGGPSGSNAGDGLPVWNSNPWDLEVFSAASTTTPQTFTNMGTAPWNPVIRINGPLNSGLQIKAAYQDVDGTGQGVVFTWTGGNINAGDFVLFDTQKLRCISSVAGAVNEVYTFSVNTVANALPFPYWPPAPPGNFTLSFTYGGADASQHSGFDLSNNGAETFRYWC